jgi:hypothetical protein
MFLIYGANGYTGELIAREAVRRGLRPILSGRSEEKIAPLAEELRLEARPFSLDKPRLDGIDAVLHCAGPFVRTSAPMVRACLEAGAHYLDITGEIAVFEAVMAMNDSAVRAGVTLLPGVGFDVVPTDCLAAMLAARLPGATELELAFYAPGAELSRGTMKTMIESIDEGGAIRRDGRIVRVPAAYDVREIPFSIGPRTAMTIGWGDVSTAPTPRRPSHQMDPADVRQPPDRARRGPACNRTDLPVGTSRQRRRGGHHDDDHTGRLRVHGDQRAGRRRTAVGVVEAARQFHPREVLRPGIRDVAPRC